MIQEIRDIETNELNGYKKDGMFVPLDKGNRHYQEILEAIQNGEEIIPAFTEEERLEYFKNKKIQELKQTRDNKVNEIKIKLSTGEYLDGNELAQTRMSRAIQALPDDTTELDWIDANNNTIKLTRPKLSEALVLAGQEQTNIFTTYNKLREQVNIATTIEDVESITFD